jgi:hypothetical protein
MTPPARRRRPKQLPAVQVRNNRHRSVPDGASANVRPPAMAVDQGLHAFKVETHYRGDTLLNRPDQQTLRAAVPPVLASRPWCPVANRMERQAIRHPRGASDLSTAPVGRLTSIT